MPEFSTAAIRHPRARSRKRSKIPTPGRTKSPSRWGGRAALRAQPTHERRNLVTGRFWKKEGREEAGIEIEHSVAPVLQAFISRFAQQFGVRPPQTRHC